MSEETIWVELERLGIIYFVVEYGPVQDAKQGSLMSRNNMKLAMHSPNVTDDNCAFGYMITLKNIVLTREVGYS